MLNWFFLLSLSKFDTKSATPSGYIKIIRQVKTHTTKGIEQKFVSQTYRVTNGKGMFAYQYQFS